MHLCHEYKIKLMNWSTRKLLSCFTSVSQFKSVYLIEKTLYSEGITHAATMHNASWLILIMVATTERSRFYYCKPYFEGI